MIVLGTLYLLAGAWVAWHWWTLNPEGERKLAPVVAIVWLPLLLWGAIQDRRLS